MLKGLNCACPYQGWLYYGGQYGTNYGAQYDYANSYTANSGSATNLTTFAPYLILGGLVLLAAKD